MCVWERGGWREEEGKRREEKGRKGKGREGRKGREEGRKRKMLYAEGPRFNPQLDFGENPPRNHRELLPVSVVNSELDGLMDWHSIRLPRFLWKVALTFPSPGVLRENLPSETGTRRKSSVGVNKPHTHTRPQAVVMGPCWDRQGGRQRD